MTTNEERTATKQLGHSPSARPFDRKPFEPLAGTDFTDEPLEVKLGMQDDAALNVPAELVSTFPDPDRVDARVLDLGCGAGDSQSVCERLGFDWIGIDIDETAGASALADAHAIPFADESFDLVLSTKVLQFSPTPARFLREVRRVLRSDGTFAGSVAFLEQFHDTYYHYTALGLERRLIDAGLRPGRISPGWEGLIAQSRMTLFPRLPDDIAMCLMLPVYLLHVLWYAGGRTVLRRDAASERYRRYMSAGEFYFTASPV